MSSLQRDCGPKVGNDRTKRESTPKSDTHSRHVPIPCINEPADTTPKRLLGGTGNDGAIMECFGFHVSIGGLHTLEEYSM